MKIHFWEEYTLRGSLGKVTVYSGERKVELLVYFWEKIPKLLAYFEENTPVTLEYFGHILGNKCSQIFGIQYNGLHIFFLIPLLLKPHVCSQISSLFCSNSQLLGQILQKSEFLDVLRVVFKVIYIYRSPGSGDQLPPFSCWSFALPLEVPEKWDLAPPERLERAVARRHLAGRLFQAQRLRLAAKHYQARNYLGSELPEVGEKLGGIMSTLD